MAVTIQTAASNALAAWLTTQMPDCTVTQRWPSPDRPLPSKAITVLTAGTRKDTDVEVNLISQIDSVTDNTTVARWQIKACEQAVQIDVWAKTDAEREDILARLDDVLNYGEAALDPVTDIYSDPARSGLVLNVADGWPSTIADFSFEGPNTPDDSDSVKRAEFRATIMGNIYVMLTVTRQSVRQVKLVLEQRLNNVDHDLMTLTPTTEVGSNVP